MSETRLPEPWLRGTLREVPPVQRAVVHALELAGEDLQRWCGSLSDEQVNARPGGLPPVAFHLRHIARSLDRLLTYAEGRDLSEPQLAALKTEMDPGATRDALFSELNSALAKSMIRVRAFDVSAFEQIRAVGRKQLPTTVAGLLVHVADHTQRHVGQAVTTAKIVRQCPPDRLRNDPDAKRSVDGRRSSVSGILPDHGRHHAGHRPGRGRFRCHRLQGIAQQGRDQCCHPQASIAAGESVELPDQLDCPQPGDPAHLHHWAAAAGFYPSSFSRRLPRRWRKPCGRMVITSSFRISTKIPNWKETKPSRCWRDKWTG